MKTKVVRTSAWILILSVLVLLVISYATGHLLVEGFQNDFIMKLQSSYEVGQLVVITDEDGLAVVNNDDFTVYDGTIAHENILCAVILKFPHKFFMILKIILLVVSVTLVVLYYLSFGWKNKL